MKIDIHTILTDIKAAARIGHEHSLWTALDGLLDFPEVSGNPPMTEAFLYKVVLPIGEALTHPRLRPTSIRPLAKQPDAVLRAIAAAYSALMLMGDGELKPADLVPFALDSRKDVRLALHLALAQVGDAKPELLLEIMRPWITAQPQRQQAVAINLLPALAQDFPQDALTLLAGLQFSPDPDWRAALADSLSALAAQGHTDNVFSQMRTWTAKTENARWVICKALSRSWAAGQAATALEILKTLTENGGPHKLINSACKALERHGAGQQVAQALRDWEKSGDEKLIAAAKQILGEE